MIPLTEAERLPSRTIKPLTIIVADDVDEIRQLVGLWLEEFGHQIRYASTGRGVVQLATEQHVDIVVTDILMPDGDGLDVIVAVKRVRPATRILAFSGGGKYMNADDCMRVAKAIGADGVLLKPFNRVQLLAAVEQLVKSL